MAWEQVLSDDDYRLYRDNISLLEEQIYHHFPGAASSPEILTAIRTVPRHFFVQHEYRTMAYTDHAFPTSGGQTTSAPSVIAEMIYHAAVQQGDKLLEIGTGTGYEASVLAEMGVNVWTIEADGYLAKKANQVLVFLGYKIDNTIEDTDRYETMLKRYRWIKKLFPGRTTVELFQGNGQPGIPEEAPFNAILIAAAVPHFRFIEHLIGQLHSRGGRMVVPIGPRHHQTLYIFARNKNRVTKYRLEGLTFDFVPFVGASSSAR
jgi:protein-L-isoaspartate(D-aspartate) O-methyltransferase